MARAAVRAKQQAKAKAQQPAKPARARGRRRHASGGNPNQELFFVRLRRGQKWLYALLAVVFAATFAGVGVGSGGGGLSQLYTGLFGGGGSSVSKAQNEVRKNPAKGYRDLATAYESNSNNVQAISALQSYVSIKKNDADAWAELGGLELSQAQLYAGQYQAAQQAAQLADPSTPFQPGGTLSSAIGSNAAYQTAAQEATSQTQQLYQQATDAVNLAVADYQHAAKNRPHDPTLQEELASAAENAGNYTTAVQAWTRYLQLYPNSPLKGQVERRIKQDKKAGASTPIGPGGATGTGNTGSSSVQPKSYGKK
jgi:tetratricopeptide (TPR) repeat protein